MCECAIQFASYHLSVLCVCDNFQRWLRVLLPLCFLFLFVFHNNIFFNGFSDIVSTMPTQIHPNFPLARRVHGTGVNLLNKQQNLSHTRYTHLENVGEKRNFHNFYFSLIASISTEFLFTSIRRWFSSCEASLSLSLGIWHISWKVQSIDGSVKASLYSNSKEKLCWPFEHVPIKSD